MSKKNINNNQMSKPLDNIDLDQVKEDIDERKEENLDESINKYDSDEESYKKPDEDEEYKDEPELEKNPKESNINSDEEDLNIGSVISKIKDFDNNVFKYEHLVYQDTYIIDEIKAFNSQKNYKINSLQELFLKVLQQFSFEDINQCLFYSEVFIYLLKKTFFMLKNSGPNDELINIFNLIQRFAAQIISKNIKYLNTKSQTKSANNFEDLNSLSSFTLQQIDFVIELYYIFITIRYLPQPDEFIDNSLEYLINLYNIKNGTKIILKEHDIIYIKKYIETIHQSIKNRKKLQICLSLEQYKNIYTLGFLLLRDHKQLNIYYYIIEMLCDIIEIVDDNHYIDKFVTEYLLCFNCFIEEYNLVQEKFKSFKFSKNLYSSYLNYFGQYKLTNSEDISLLTFFLMKISCYLYLKNSSYFTKFIEDFLHKIFSHNNQSFLLYILFIFKDFTKMKYDIEFSISINILTHIYLSITSLLSTPDTNLPCKKFLVIVLKFFMGDLLKDLKSLRNSYLCFGKQNDELKKLLHINDSINSSNNNNKKKNKNKNNKKEKEMDMDIEIKSEEQKCECFSCTFSTINKMKSFKCGKCDINTNLRLQLIDPNKDDDLTICGFCNINDYFRSCSNIFENEDKLELIKTNDNIFAQYSKYSKSFKNNKKNNNKKKNKDSSDDDKEKMDDILSKPDDESNNNTNNNKNNKENELFDKCVFYQEMMYKKVFLFLKLNLLNFIYISNQVQTQDKCQNIFLSFKVFLRSLLQEEQLKDKNYITFIENLEQFFKMQKERVFNLHQDINIDEKTIQYFYFFHFYINFLFNGHWKILEILISEKSQHWQIKYQCMKILEKFIDIDKEANIFQNLSVSIVGPLLCDSSLNIREYSFELLFKLYQKKKIQRTDLIYILYNNINESSFIIRKRAIKALSNLVFYEKERDSLKSIILIFLNKIYDNSESDKIKSIIYDFFVQLFKNNLSTNNELLYYFLNIIIELFSGSEEISGNYSNYLSTQLNLLFEKIYDKINTYDIVIDYLMQNYIINKDKSNNSQKNENNENQNEELSLTQRMGFIHALNFVQILTKYYKKSISIYIEYFCSLLEYNGDIVLHNNRIIQLSCMIIGNYFEEKKSGDNDNSNIVEDEDTFTIKYKTLCKIENLLLNIIMNKAPVITFSALETYFKMIKNGVIDVDKIEKFALMNFTFLKKLKEDEKKIISTQENIISKSLTIFSYIIYSLTDSEIINTFKDIYQSLDIIKEVIFELLSFYYLFKYNLSLQKTKRRTEQNIYLYNLANSLSTKAFQSFTYFWVRFPYYLLKSDKIIQTTFDNMENADEKIIVLQSFNRLFKDMSRKCEESRINKDNSFDFGIVHLFFENFIDKINLFLVEENCDIVRLEAIHLIKLIIDLGNLNVHKIIPYAFASLFDCINEIRCVAVEIIQKGFSISKDKSLNALGEGLKQAFNFQKKKYGSSKLINSFVKIIDPETKEYKSSNENIFELLFYKINKNKIKFQKKILEKYLSCIQEISNMENSLNISSSSNAELKKCLNLFEYYEFIAKLIGDFKFQNSDEVYLVYDKLYMEYENNICVFKAKFKQYKEDESVQKMDIKLIINYLKSGLYLFLLRFLFIKYQIFSEDQLNDINNEGWKKFLEKNINIDNKKIKLPKKLESRISKFKFIEFYSNFEILNIQLFDNQLKSYNKFNKENKTNINICLGRMKSFSNLDINKFIGLYNGKKRSLADLSFKILFDDNNKGVEKLKRKTMFSTDIKVRNRISMNDNNESSENKNNDKVKEEEKEEKEESKKKKRNVKKKVKIPKSEVKKAKKKVKHRKSVVVIEEKDEMDD